jgi:ribonucleoside-diphosphate reductase alpha chain
MARLGRVPSERSGRELSLPAKGIPLDVGKAGGSAMADAETMGRLISLALRSGIPITEVHGQLRGISSDRAVGLGPNTVLSVPDAIGIALEQWWRDKQGVQQDLLPTQTPPLGTPVVPQSVAVRGPVQAQGLKAAVRRR